MRGASVNFQKIHSAMHAVSHASRQVPPQYLLPAEHSLGTHVVIDDKGEVQKKLTEKMALASRQAKASKDYSPLWEGVINLPHPSKGIAAQHQIKIVKAWCDQYEAITGHKVLRADVHLDEGFVDASGKPQFNAHAHVMCDRTDAAGKVIKLSPKQLREVQGMTAEITQLQRGKDARKTGRQHLNHVQFRFAAEQGRQKLEQSNARYEKLFDTQLGVLVEEREKVKTLTEALTKAEAEVTQAKAQAEAAQEQAQKLATLAEQYKAERDALMASGVAKQADYQALKQQYEAAKAALTTALGDAEKAKGEATQAKGEAEQAKAALTAQAATAQEQAQKLATLAEQYKVERDALKASGTAKQADYQALKAQYEAAKEQLEAAQADAKEAKEGQRLFHDELERTTKDLIQAEQKLYKLEKAKTQPTPQPTPEKSLGERISASFEAMLEWIKAKGGGFRELKPDGYYIGPIEKMDDLHAAMRVGLDDYVIHRLDHLSRPISMESNVEEIQYRDGRGYVKPQQREQGMDFGR